jgi:hypothetical protein
MPLIEENDEYVESIVDSSRISSSFLLGLEVYLSGA